MSLQQIIQNSLSLIEDNLNTSFSTQLSEFLQNQNFNSENLWKPLIDMMEDDNFIIIYVNIPGVNEKLINTEFFNDIISIKGQRDYPGYKYGLKLDKIISRKQEIIYGNFIRKIKLPFSITNPKSVNINANNGVLIIKINKNNENQKKFSIKISDS